MSPAYDHGNPSNAEQYLVELINRARSDPAAEAARYGIDLNEGLRPGTLSPAPRAPLPFNPNLIKAAPIIQNGYCHNIHFLHIRTSGKMTRPSQSELKRRTMLSTLPPRKMLATAVPGLRSRQQSMLHTKDCLLTLLKTK